jgi:hypothetical protein
MAVSLEEARELCLTKACALDFVALTDDDGGARDH